MSVNKLSYFKKAEGLSLMVTFPLGDQEYSSNTLKILVDLGQWIKAGSQKGTKVENEWAKLAPKWSCYLSDSNINNSGLVKKRRGKERNMGEGVLKWFRQS